MLKPTQSRPLWEAREYEGYFSQFIDESTRPLLHLSPLVGWMNDPNGFSFYDGQYHLFYQYNPYATTWAPMHWGHAVTDDLIKWTHRQAAHLIIYTGVAAGGRDIDGTVNDRQTQCIAVGNGYDYTKWEGNPAIDVDQLPEGADERHFRDPKIWQEDDGTYRCVVASLGEGKRGQILLFSSEDAFTWKSEGVLASNDGSMGRMWECPDFFELDGMDVLLVSPQDMLPVRHDFHGGNNTICLLGHRDEETGRLVEESVTTVDHGIDFYATQTTLSPDGRRIMVAWMQNWDTITSISDDDRWFGQVTIPRELSIKDGKLIQWPIRELEAYRTGCISFEGVKVSGTVELEGVRGRCADVELTIRSADCDDPYREFAIWFAQDERFHTCLRYRPAKGELKIDRTRSGSRRAILQNRKCIIDESHTRDELSLRIVLDLFSAEIFINHGEMAMTVTIPTDQQADGITFFADGNAVMDVVKYDLTDEGDLAR